MAMESTQLMDIKDRRESVLMNTAHPTDTRQPETRRQATDIYTN